MSNFLVGTNLADVQLDKFSGNASTVAFTLSVASSTFSALVRISGVVQTPTDDFSIVNSTLTFTTAPPSGTNNIVVTYTKATQIGVPNDASVSASKLASNAVTTAKILDANVTLAKMASGTDGNIISYDASGNPVAIATGTDGQVLTSAGAGAQPAFETLPTATDITGAFFQAVPSANVSLPNSTYTKISFDTEIYDPMGEYDHTTNYRYQPAAGTYLISAKITLISASDGHRWIAVIYKNGTGQNYNYTINANGSDENTTYISQIVTTTGSDYYEIFVWQATGTRAVYGSGTTGHSYFQGHRIA